MTARKSLYYYLKLKKRVIWIITIGDQLEFIGFVVFQMFLILLNYKIKTGIGAVSPAEKRSLKIGKFQYILKPEAINDNSLNGSFINETQNNESQEEHIQDDPEVEQTNEVSHFSFIYQLNWAWEFLSSETGNWTQFECTVCMILESKY